MNKTLIICAYTSNSGGGRTGLMSILETLEPGRPAIVFIDSRLTLPFALPESVRLERVEPSVLGRLRAERRLRALSTDDTWVLKLGSVPPLFRLGVPVFTYFENRYLISGTALPEGMPVKERARIFVERRLIELFAGNTTQFFVQSESMAEGVRRMLRGKVEVGVIPFHSTQSLAAAKPAPVAAKDLDFLYPSTGHPHKNHRTLVEAWCLLAKEGLKPSLAITVDKQGYPELAAWIEDKTRVFQLNLKNVGFVQPVDLLSYYARSKAMIFPSTCESFGRPILEAKDFDLPVIAGETDFVRDVVDPDQSFDPLSAISIARAVKRFLGSPERRETVLPAAQFLSEMEKRASRERPK